ncbi:NADH-quinone oxidoreductase subunit N [Candidatus Tachikawaea gelatinosa]|uniref:NADH-quinone oxidoreductase subunit N n=1 Tax=Candidatus Tachikawaea gelatinosa TaxID=1410383 RepID=A0A090ARD6_9ENTR|nr:NADH-quinone oxidoreductase subunit N [Candidatus Tachikawaea gelatinosa]BAP58325.1 NADH-quinone oxidoreductase subunit N [Candidatus Tachikawaea gelatinosa]
MKITMQQLIALFPFIIVASTTILVMLSIIFKRNNFLNVIFVIIGLFFALFSCFYLIKNNQTINIASMFEINNYSIFFCILILLTSIITCFFAHLWLKFFQYNTAEFYLLTLIATLGSLTLVISVHFASVFVSLELLSLPLLGLIGYSFHQKKTIESAIKYTILSGVTSAFVLFGIGLIYLNTGKLNFFQLYEAFYNNRIINYPLLLIGFGMLITGIFFKMSIFPFHLWTPDIYEGSPIPVTNFLATISKISIFSFFLQLLCVFIPIEEKSIYLIISIMAAFSIIFGNLMAINQMNLKRLIGYSSIAHFGYLIISVVGLETINFNFIKETIIVYIIGYLLSIICVFGIINLMASFHKKEISHADSLYCYRGLFWKNPVLAITFTVSMLSLAGIPSTFGFLGKFYIIVLSMQTSSWFLVFAILLGSAIGLYYYLRVVISLFLKERSFDNIYEISKNWCLTPTGLIIITLSFLNILFGILPQLLFSFLKKICVI